MQQDPEWPTGRPHPTHLGFYRCTDGSCWDCGAAEETVEFCQTDGLRSVSRKKTHVSVRLETDRQTARLPANSVRLIYVKGNKCWHIHTVSEGTGLTPTARGQLKSVHSNVFPGRRHFVSVLKLHVRSDDCRGAGGLNNWTIICRYWNNVGESSSVSTDCRLSTGT